MGYTNSLLAEYVRLSPNHSGQRGMAIDRVTPHCVAGQCTAEGLGEWFSKTSTQASSNYGIDRDGRVGLYVEEKNRSWCTSSNANDQRAVTIECASDTSEPYWMNEKVYAKLIELCADICRRNGKKKLLWFADKNKALSYSPKSDEMLLTVHRWFANKSCPGNWLYARLGDLAAKVTEKLGDADGKVVYEPKEAESAVEVPFLVKVCIRDLNIRKGPGTDYDRVQLIPIGVYTIVEVKAGKGSYAGWGRLKSGIGWISLDFVRRI